MLSSTADIFHTFWYFLATILRNLGFSDYQSALESGSVEANSSNRSDKLFQSCSSSPSSVSVEMKVKIPLLRNLTQDLSVTSSAVDDALRDRSNSLSSLQLRESLRNNLADGIRKSADALEHHFCPIPLDADTFCDACSCPIYSLGSGPICERCADCHITCHRICTRNVRVACNRGLNGEQPTRSANDANLTDSPDIPVGSKNYQDLSAEFAQLSVLDNNLNQACADAWHRGTSSQSQPSVMDTTSHSSGVRPRQENCTSAPGEGDLPDLNQTTYYTAKSQMSTSLPRSLTADIPSYVYRDRPSTPDSTPAQSTLTSELPDLIRLPHYPILRKSNKKGPTAITSRHSFLAGNRPDSSLSSRLAYNFSSLDRDTISTHGIEVKQIIPAPPPHKDSKDSPSDGSPCTTPVSPTSHYSVESDSPSFLSANSEIGLATVMQSTAEFLKTKAPRYSKPSGFTPPSSPALFPVVVGPRGRLPYTLEQLNERLSVFNANEYGLHSRTSQSLPPGDCEGQVRVHINLLRPIRMLLTVRPLSIFDLVGQEDEPEDEFDPIPNEPTSPVCDKPLIQTTVNGVHRIQPKSSVNAAAPPFSADSDAPLRAVGRRFSKRLFGPHPQSSTFWLPRGSTKLLYVRLSTTVQAVITLLLDRFQITDNPQKFALYEHTIEGEHKVSVRKLFDDESPLGLVLRWTENGREQFNKLLAVKRLVLQENETGDIEWSGFSLPELNTFLSILNSEEADYRRRIEMKYEFRRKEIMKLIARHDQARMSTVTTDDCSQSTAPVRGSCEIMDPQADNTLVSAESSNLNGEAECVLTSELDDQKSLSSASTTPAHSPERTVRTTSTLPGFFFSKKKNAYTLFKPSAYKQMKKAEKAREKLAVKLDKERVKAEAKRLKAEAKQQTQSSQKDSTSHHHARRFFGFTGRQISSPNNEASVGTKPPGTRP